ncbi:dihydropteroate synthase [Anaerosporomusa subterranea]|uniref:Dihydropteroate synthase n=1 Tax=Anaerosporomusa subterranea TaxID=1794912 RepID=A0A154BTQ6_ANASB|nr:dihydropteroate synthase [Anaerosporomusa subterranea]KYZ77311.1 dihydropteroate synthase [Anaerosporomusa subterranea]
MLNPRVVLINNNEAATRELQQLGCDPQGIAIMAAKAIFKTVKIEGVSTKAANLLKQTFLAKGGEVAVARGTADLSIEHTDVLIFATLKQYRLALNQLKQQPWGLPQLAERIENSLRGDAIFPMRHYEWHDRSLSIQPGRTLVMGILNLTPDSFSDGGKYNQVEKAVQHACEMVELGADIIDIGAESTRPYGSQLVSEQEEMARLLPILDQVLAKVSVPVSVDTYKASVAKAALAAGAHIVNDIWGLHTPGMAEVAAAQRAPVIIMHNQVDSIYQHDIMSDMITFLEESIEIGIKAGIPFENFIVDPGIGFGKTTVQNLEVMARLGELKSLGCPILLATSRKRFIGEALGGLPPQERVEGTGATVAWGIMQGVQMVRVHDVKEIVRVTRMIDTLVRRDFHA